MVEEEKDLIESMKCRTCKYFDYEKSECIARHDRSDFKFEKVNPDTTCSFWEKDERNLTLEAFKGIEEILKDYIDTSEENYDIISLWILGTYFYDKFETWPYLFIHAMKGSGKTRVLKIIKELSYKGDMLVSLTDAVLFRTTGTLSIDELEGIESKEKNSLRELLNTAYKRGGKVARLKKKRTPDGEQQVVEEFSTFRPIAMANINGMEEILNDRCIPIILEKSNKAYITRKIEDFSTNPKFNSLRLLLGVVMSFSVNVVVSGIYAHWNNFLNVRTFTDVPINDIHTYIYNITYNDTEQHQELHQIMQKIYDTNIDGRNLELTFPLLILANEMGMLERFIAILKTSIEDRREEDMMESKDIMLFDFISRQQPNEYYRIQNLSNAFGLFIDYNSTEGDHWLNAKWMGHALRRLSLVLKKRRIGEGREVLLDITKANEKVKMFRN